MKISINIPSYRRADDVKTLAYIPFAKVWVDEAEYEAYKANYPNAEVIACPSGIQGYGVPRVRNYIMEREFAEGADVVAIVDDDLQCIERYTTREGDAYGYYREKLETEDILTFLEKYSIMAQDMGVYFWGINCNMDSLGYKHQTPFSTLAYIGGPFQVFLKGNDCKYDEAIPLKEDYDMTLQQVRKHRAILRVNYYHYLCNQSEKTGGCATIRNRERERENNEALRRKWGSKIVKYDKSNKGHTTKLKVHEDYNPIIRIPIKGV